MNRQRRLPLHQGQVTEAQVYHAYLRNAPVHTACSWDEVVRSSVLFGCLAREARYTHRGQMPARFSPVEPMPITTGDNPMPKHVAVLDAAQVGQIKLALALCRERIACPATTTVEKEEAVRELKAAQAIFREHEDRQAELNQQEAANA